jgi:hypothetical protein
MVDTGVDTGVGTGVDIGVGTGIDIGVNTGVDTEGMSKLFSSGRLCRILL